MNLRLSAPARTHARPSAAPGGVLASAARAGRAAAAPAQPAAPLAPRLNGSSIARPATTRGPAPPAAAPPPWGPPPSSRLVLEDGAVFWGRPFGAVTDAIGECVFNTSLSGAFGDWEKGRQRERGGGSGGERE